MHTHISKVIMRCCPLNASLTNANSKYNPFVITVIPSDLFDNMISRVVVI